MSKDELIEYAIRTSEVIKEDKKMELINYFYNKKEVIDKAVEYITSYESISTIQGLAYIKDNKQFEEMSYKI